MNQKRIFWIILLFLIASLDISLARNLEQEHGMQGQKPQLLEEDALARIRAFVLPQDAYAELAGWTEEDGKKLNTALGFKKNGQKGLCENILAYLFCQSLDRSKLRHWCALEQEAAPELYADYTEIVENLLADAVYFPVPEAVDHKKATLSYENSWQSERTYGGARGHEGCDLMAAVQQRGYYPVVSVSGGSVEKMGWLPQGGYRIGIRSRHGVYYYYAHLAEYEDGITEGTQVAAGQLIGYMGDTGYSEVEGTTGNFPVHLHFGMYLDLDGYGEVSFNPYYLLQLLERNKLRYVYQKR